MAVISWKERSVHLGRHAALYFSASALDPPSANSNDFPSYPHIIFIGRATGIDGPGQWLTDGEAPRY
jgi:hypothetical protein